MKAIRVHQFGGPEVMKLEEIPTPAPGPGQILLRIHAAGVNPVETYIRSGAYAALPPLPYTPGKDGAGTIEATGSGVDGWNPGDRVFTSGSLTGTYAEFAICDASEIHRLPERISFAQGAGINTPYATAYRSLFQRALAKPGETVLIHGGSGGVGTAAIQFARAAGLRVFATGGTERGLALVQEEGAHRVFNHRSTNYREEIMTATSSRGVDIVLEMLANVNLGHDLTMLGNKGRVVIIGSRGKVEINPRDAMLREADIMGVLLFNASPEEKRAIYASIVAGLESGVLKPVVGKELPLVNAPTAHEVVLEPGSYGKIILVP